MATLRSLGSVYINAVATAYLGKKTNRDPDYILTFNNCLLDISKRRSIKIEPSDNYYILDWLEYNYERHAKCNKWKKFLEEIFESDLENDPSIMILQEIMGLLLTAQTKYHKIFGLVAPPRSGKSTITKVMMQLLGRNRVYNNP